MSLDQQLKELKRELGQRQRLYPRWIGEGKLKQADADHRLACMTATIAVIESMIEAKRQRDEPTLF